MSDRIMVPYDGSASADHAVEEAMILAKEEGADLYILAITPDGARPAQSALPVDARLMEDLVTFAHFGAQLGVEVDGSYLESPTEALLHSVIETHHISRVVMAHDEKTAAASRNGKLLQSLAASCPVPVTVLKGDRNDR